MSPGPLVDGGGAARAVLVAQPGGAGHVVVRDRGWLHRLQGLIRGVPPAQHRSTRSCEHIRTDCTYLQHRMTVISISMSRGGSYRAGMADQGMCLEGQILA